MIDILGCPQIPLRSLRHVSDTFDVSSESQRVELCCFNMADDEQAIVLACTSLVVFMLLHSLHKSYLFRQIK